MQNSKRTTFDELVQLASDFVIQQKGVWDHVAWMGFLSHVESRGVDVSQEMEIYLGELVESIKRFHTSILSVEGTMLALNKLVAESALFIVRQNGVWGSSEWIAYCQTVSKSTIYLSDEMRSYLGGILESMRTCFLTVPSLPRAIMRK
jgi:uncharacterized membrane protein (DUF2068 family)